MIFLLAGVFLVTVGAVVTALRWRDERRDAIRTLAVVFEEMEGYQPGPWHDTTTAQERVAECIPLHLDEAFETAVRELQDELDAMDGVREEVRP